jgi:serine-type D-Ala-D-Ala carboxypeptidase (penicillin-binding protein 5/6)
VCKSILITILLTLLVLSLAAAPASGGTHISALLMEAETGQVLFADEIDRQWIPASVVKLMMLLLVQEAVESGSVAWEDSITATSRAQRQGGSQVYLGAGERSTVRKLTEAAAVGSANDAIVALGEGIFGSFDAAVEAMNRRAAVLGMTGTVYVNITGLPERRGLPENHTTARDQARLAREIVLEHPDLLQITSLTWTRFRKKLVVPCTNILLKEFPGLDGLKTGYHHKARSNLVATAERNGRRFIAVVLGARSQRVRNETATDLLEQGFDDWLLVDAMATGQDFGQEFQVAGSWNASVPVAAGSPLRYLVRPADAPRVKVILSDDAAVVAPLKAGQQLGEIQAVLDGCVLASVPALAGRRVARAWIPLPFNKKSHPRPVLSADMLGK